MRLAALVCALAAGVHVCGWLWAERKVTAPANDRVLTSTSYTPFDGSVAPDSAVRTSRAQIRADLAAVAPLTRAVRTYASTGGSELIPEVASEFGVHVTAGAWIDQDPKRNDRELASVVFLARHNPSVKSIVVGNETIYRKDQTVDELIQKIARVKRETSLPVTTGEIWHIWLQHPELAAAVDYIAAHILPYWEGIPSSEAVAHTLRIYERLKSAFPEKRIVIAEFGWPSAGHNRLAAQPGPLEQARVLREFLSAAHWRGIEYNIIEAYDQPWKTHEGGVGPYWGLYDTDRQPKFSWRGDITYPGYSGLMALAVIIGAVLALPVLFLPAVTLTQAFLLAGAAHGIGAWCAYVLDFWMGHYFVAGAAFAFGLGLLLLVPLLITSFQKIAEIASLALGRRPRRLITSAMPAGPGYQPKVSIHIPACKERPDMVIATLNSVARLDYPSFECIVVVNNTPDPAMWQPIEEHCRQLGERFTFVREDRLAGYKAGALRLALTKTAADAAIIGVLDADYVVQPGWLRDLVPTFWDPKVGIVQAPQDHRDADRSVMHHALNSEYAGFFDIGMVRRNEADSIIVHGTMCLIRREALEAAGSWSSDTICEDTDLGLAILEKGWSAQYTDRRYGHGLLPDTYLAYKRQRFRWAFGGVQIARKHWSSLVSGRSEMRPSQIRVFMLGWLEWLGAESLGVLLAFLNLLIVPFVAFAGTIVPDKVLTLPILAAFTVTVAHFLVLYRSRVQVSRASTLGALLAAMSVQWTIARAVGLGLIRKDLPFVVTAKGGVQRFTTSFPAFWESLLGTMLAASAIFVYWSNTASVVEINLFAVVLAVQSLPLLSAGLIATLERVPLNDPAFWVAARHAAARFSLIERDAQRLRIPPHEQTLANRVQTREPETA